MSGYNFIYRIMLMAVHLVLSIFRVYTECIQKGVSVNELVTISKKHEKKLVVRFILINSIIALCFLVNPVLQRAVFLPVSVFILLIIMAFLLDYYFLLLSPYKKIIFHDSSLTAVSRFKSHTIPYTDILSLRERKGNSVLLVSKTKKLHILGMTTDTHSIDDRSRTANIIREEIRKRTGVTTPIVYKDM